jgi:hypothetical protein
LCQVLGGFDAWLTTAQPISFPLASLIEKAHQSAAGQFRSGAE